LYFFMRNDGLLWGVVLASMPMLARWARPAAARLARVPLAGLVILVAAIGEMARLSPFFEQSPPYLVGAMAAVAAVPVWLASADRDLFAMGRLQRAVLWMGSRSYALYLCHVPLYQCAAALARFIGDGAPMVQAHTDLVATIIALPVLAAAAELTYRCVEQPLRGVGVRIAGRWRREESASF
jgi:peptidoglycan/LPS O-acetylase OafA/YrhL